MYIDLQKRVVKATNLDHGTYLPPPLHKVSNCVLYPLWSGGACTIFETHNYLKYKSAYTIWGPISCKAFISAMC